MAETAARDLRPRGSASLPVVVVGGGAIGLCVARELARRGVEVVLLERGELASGASGRALGMVRVLHADPWISDLALEAFEELALSNDPEWTRTGFLRLFAPAEYAAVEREVARLSAAGAVLELVPAATGRLRFPHLDWAGLGGAVHERLAGWRDPRATCARWAAQARDLGADLRAGVDVRELVVRDGRARAVRTAGGTIEAAAVVIATAAGTADLRAGAGTADPRASAGVADLRAGAGVAELGAVRPRAIQVERLRASGLSCFPALVDPTTGLYGRPDADGFLLGLPVDGERDDAADERPWDEARAAETLRVARERMPWLADATVDGGLRARDGYTASGRGLLGPAEGAAGLVLATGWSGAGFKLAPAVGVRVARLLAGLAAEPHAGHLARCSTEGVA